MSTASAAARYFDALAAAQDAVIDAVRVAGAANARRAQLLLDETQSAQRRALDLGRRLTENPSDFAGNLAAVIEATAEAQSRALSFSRAWFEGAPETQDQARELFERLTRANQELAGAGMAVVREFYTAAPWLQAFLRPTGDEAKSAST
jgi:hypothetical protein